VVQNQGLKVLFMVQIQGQTAATTHFKAIAAGSKS
jgi:hypothetical protein